VNEQLWWHMARASGLVAWALCTASVAWGLLLSTKLMGRRAAPNWLLDLHRFLGGLATVFVGVHVVALVADSYVSFGPAELLIPMASAWKPGPVAWGVVSLYLLVAVEVTSLARKRLPAKLWRATHMASFPMWAFATVHTLTAGTDASHPGVVLLSIASLGAVLFATVVRFLSPRSAARAAARTTAAASRVAADPTPPDPVPAATADPKLERLAQRSAAARAARGQQD
jgi:predicted ferric reductase